MLLSIIRKCGTLLMCLVIFLPSCGENKKVKGDEEGRDIAIKTQPVNEIASDAQGPTNRDTTITYSIEGLSAEGSELEAHYIRDTIKEVNWRIFGETGQWVIKYIFLNKVVMAEEKKYVYEKSISKVNGEGDMKLKSRLNFVLDTSGRLITKIEDSEFVNLFPDMKAEVPFILRK